MTASWDPQDPASTRADSPDGAAPPVQPLRPGEPPLAILVDYDGTIALTDVSDTVMAETSPPSGKPRLRPTTPG